MGLCLAVSGIIGFANKMTHWREEPTNEMLSRANFKYENIWLELVMSGIAGIGIYYAIMKTSTIALIGLIFAISIIPPLCNAGLFWGMHLCNLLGQFWNDERENTNQFENSKTNNYIEYGIRSFAIFASNITGMFFGFMMAFAASCVF